MSNLRVALIAEGPTDRVLVEAALRAILQRPFTVAQLQPEPTRPRFGAGWCGVFKWCREFAARSYASLEEDPTLPGFDLFVIHLDSDVAEMRYADGGAAVEDAAAGLPALPCSRPSFRDAAAAGAAGNPQPGRADCHQPATDPHQVAPDPRQLDVDRRHPPPAFDGGSGAPTDQEAADRSASSASLVPVDLPDELKASLGKMGKRPRAPEVRALILGFCAWRPMSARELAALLGDRDHKVLVRQHLTPMSETGELTLTIPEMPHHPDQKYTVPGKTVQ